MAIRVKPRAEVTPGFMEEYRILATKFAANKFTEMKNARADARAGMIQRNKAALARLTPIINDVHEAGKGTDFEISRLRSSNYERYFVYVHHGTKYLCGGTRPIIAETYRAGRRRGGAWRTSTKTNERYDIGKYCIYVPVDDILQGAAQKLHFIPTDDPYTTERHWHHAASLRQTGDHFLDYAPNTCWGSVGEPVVDCMLSVHLSELFRMLWVYLARHDASSELVRFHGGRMINDN